MEEQIEGAEPEVEINVNRNFSLQDAFKASSERIKQTRAPARRRITFVMDLESVAVDDELVKAGDVEVTIQTLSVREETNATAKAESGMEMGFAMAQRSIYAVNGEVVSQGVREWFWNGVGPAGRNLIATKFADLSAPSEDAQKKADQTVQMG